MRRLVPYVMGSYSSYHSRCFVDLTNFFRKATSEPAVKESEARRGLVRTEERRGFFGGVEWKW